MISSHARLGLCFPFSSLAIGVDLCVSASSNSRRLWIGIFGIGPIPLRIFNMDQYETAISGGLETEAADMLSEIASLRQQVTDLQWYKEEYDRRESARESQPRGGWQVRACALLGAWIADKPGRFKHLVEVQLGPFMF